MGAFTLDRSSLIYPKLLASTLMIGSRHMKLQRISKMGANWKTGIFLDKLR